MNNTSENGIATLITHLPVHSWYNRWCILSRWSVLCDSQLLACLGSVYWWNSYFGLGVNGCTMSKFETVRLITYPISLRWSSYVAAYWYIYSIHYFDGWFGLDRRIGCFGHSEVVQKCTYFTVHNRTCMEVWEPWAMEIWTGPLIVPFLSVLRDWNRPNSRVMDFDMGSWPYVIYVPGNSHISRTWCPIDFRLRLIMLTVCGWAPIRLTEPSPTFWETSSITSGTFPY